MSPLGRGGSSQCRNTQSSLPSQVTGPEDELGGAAALHLPVAGVDVDAVHRERLQAGDLQLALRHGLLREIKLPVGRLQVGRGAAVARGLGRLDGGAVGVQPVAAGLSGVGDAVEISAPAIWRPAGERKGTEASAASASRSSTDLGQGQQGPLSGPSGSGLVGLVSSSWSPTPMAAILMGIFSSGGRGGGR
ncbi:hypothetical protein EYF80_025758 [Liparis tanakae]|uniref:Uncharacterized protein n=1 Tax=Liparis tanakae TaxID=230148 RepID=A0A4Z2HFG2_9TELE|nr:hypothetical protein EYF80_025758 [Liparis tanakae]